MPIAAVRKMQATSPIFEEIMYLHNDKERRKETKKKRLDQAYVFGYPDPLIGFFKGLGPIRNYKQNNKIFNRYLSLYYIFDLYVDPILSRADPLRRVPVFSVHLCT